MCIKGIYIYWIYGISKVLCATTNLLSLWRVWRCLPFERWRVVDAWLINKHPINPDSSLIHLLACLTPQHSPNQSGWKKAQSHQLVTLPLQNWRPQSIFDTAWRLYLQIWTYSANAKFDWDVVHLCITELLPIDNCHILRLSWQGTKTQIHMLFAIGRRCLYHLQ